MKLVCIEETHSIELAKTFTLGEVIEDAELVEKLLGNSHFKIQEVE